jgi:hypothetical protein
MNFFKILIKKALNRYFEEKNENCTAKPHGGIEIMDAEEVLQKLL